ISYITKAPSDDLEGEFSIGSGSHDTQRVSAMVSGPLSEQLSGRISAFYSDEEGYIDNIWTGKSIGDTERWGVRGRMQWVPSDRWTVDVSAFHQESDIVGMPPQVWDA